MSSPPYELVDRYISCFRELVNEAVASSIQEIDSSLRLNDSKDWDYLTTAMDVVEDSNEAISNFYKFGTGGRAIRENVNGGHLKNVGERYLRLYGLLSATYLQQEAVYELHKRMNVPNPKELKKSFGAIEIRNLRNKIAAHSTNHMEKDGSSAVYVPVRFNLDDYSCSVTSFSREITENVDLRRVLNEHCNAMENALEQLLEKSIKTVFKGKENLQKKYEYKLSKHSLWCWVSLCLTQLRVV